MAENECKAHVLVPSESKHGGGEDNHAENRLPRCPRVEAEVLVDSLALHKCPWRLEHERRGGRGKTHHGIPPLNGGVRLKPLSGWSSSTSMKKRK